MRIHCSNGGPTNFRQSSPQRLSGNAPGYKCPRQMWPRTCDSRSPLRQPLVADAIALELCLQRIEVRGWPVRRKEKSDVTDIGTQESQDTCANK